MVREGRWAEGRPQLLTVPRLMGQTLGFIAFGRVARATARRATAFGLQMMAFDPYRRGARRSSALGVEPASLSEVLSSSDFVSMHLPDTPESRGFLKEKHFRQMKKTAIFINTGRGPTVNEAALIKALQERLDRRRRSRRVRGGADQARTIRCTRCSNVILSPHNASASARFDPARKRRVGQELALMLPGKWPMSCVNPTVLPASGAEALAALSRWSAARTRKGRREGCRPSRATRAKMDARVQIILPKHGRPLHRHAVQSGA